MLLFSRSTKVTNKKKCKKKFSYFTYYVYCTFSCLPIGPSFYILYLRLRTILMYIHDMGENKSKKKFYCCIIIYAYKELLHFSEYTYSLFPCNRSLPTPSDHPILAFCIWTMKNKQTTTSSTLPSHLPPLPMPPSENENPIHSLVLACTAASVLLFSMDSSIPFPYCPHPYISIQ